MLIFRNLFLIVTALLFSFSPNHPQFNADVMPQESPGLECATDGLHELLSERDEKYRRGLEQLEKEWSEVAGKSPRRKMPPPYEIPVVFHVVHENGAENITEGDILRSLDFLNQSFANQGYYDQGVGVDTEIQFCLARRTPDNQPTNGINRIVSPLTNVEATAEDRDLKDLSRWNPREYVNIWVVREICGLGLGCGVAGYAYYPSAHGGGVDGIVVEARWLTTNEARATVLTHEMGHYLGLRHTFDGGCTNDDCTLDGDRVCDTPPDNSKAAVPCSGTANSCTTDTNSGFGTDQNDMFNNYMDYGNWSCYNTLTAGQRDRMYFFLEGRRRSLLESPGCLDPCPAPIVASFTGGEVMIDIGTILTFTNTSTNGDNLLWRLDGTDFSTTNTANQTFNSLGTFTVSLTVSSNDPLCTPETVSQRVTVTCPVVANFDIPTELEDGTPSVFTNTSVAGANYVWSVDGNPVATTRDLDFTFAAPGLYEICLTTDNNFCSEEYCRLVFVQRGPCTDCPITDDCGNAFAFSYQQPGGRQDGLFTAVLPANGIFYVGGTYGGSPIVMAIAANGVPIWQQQLFPENRGAIVSQLILDAEGLLSGVGFTGVDVADPAESFAFRMEPADGSLRWAQTYPSQSWEVKLLQLYHPTASGPLVALGQMDEPNSPTNFNASGTRFTIDPATGALVNPPDRYDNDLLRGFLDAVFDPLTGIYYTISIQQDLTTGQFSPQISAQDLGGVHQWSLSYEAGDAFALEGLSLTEDGDDLVFLVNDFGSASQPSGFQVWKIDKTGQIQWVRKYTPGFSMPLKVRTNATGYVLWGYVGTSERQMIVQLDRDGNFLWANVYENIPAICDFNNALATENNQTILALGTRLGSIYPTLLRINLDGSTVQECIPYTPVELDEIPVRGNISPEDLERRTEDFQESRIFNEPGLLVFNPESCQEPCPPVDSCVTTANLQYTEPNGFTTGVFTAAVEDDLYTYVAGSVNNTAYVAALDDTGNPVWQHQILGDEQTDYQVQDLLLDSRGFLIALGQEAGLTAGGRFFAGKFNPVDGTPLWIREYQDAAPMVVHRLIQPTALGNYFIAGGLGDASATGFAGMILEVDLNTGVPQSTSRVFDTTTEFIDAAVDPGNNTIYALSSSAGQTEIISLNTALTPQWGRIYRAGVDDRLEGRALLWQDNHLFFLAANGGNSVDLVQVAGNNGQVNTTSTVETSEDLDPNRLMGLNGRVASLSIGRTSLRYQTVIWESNTTPVRGFINPITNGGAGGQLGGSSQGNILLSGRHPGNNFPILLRTDRSGTLPEGCDSSTVLDFIGYRRAITASFSQSFGRRIPELITNNLDLFPANLLLSPGSCLAPCESEEICDNQIDDDGDGFIDCLDPDLANNCCCLGGPLVNLGPDTTICTGSFLLAPDTLRGLSLAWSTGATTDSILIDREGLYWLTATDTCGYVASDTIRLHLRSAPSLELGPDTTLCQNGVFPFSAQDGFLEYEWVDGSTEKSFTAYDAGVYWVNATDSCGNVQSDTVRVFIDPATEIELGPDTTICRGDTISFRLTGFSNYQWSDTDFIDCTNCPEVRVWPQRDTLLLVSGEVNAGCISSDSIRIRVQSSVGTRSSTTLCPGDSLTYGGQMIRSAGQFYADNTNGVCLATDTLDVLLLRDTLTTEQLTICQGDSVLIFGQFERQANDYEARFVANNGCDSLHRIRLNVLSAASSQDSLTICAGDSAFIFGQFVRQPDTYTRSFVASNGCDSTRRITLTVLDTLVGRENLSICAGDSIMIFGRFERSAGTYTQSFLAANGCDSLHRVELSLRQPVSTTEMRSICAGDSSLIFGQFERTGNVYTQNFVGGNGCDSTHQITLMVRDTSSGRDSLTVCAGDSILIFGQFERSAGTYTQSFLAANGCDSIHRTTLTVLPPAMSQATESICAGDSVLIFGQFRTAANTYTQTFTAANGCDSTHRVALTVRDTVTTRENVTTCAGDSVLIFGQFARTAGVYAQTFTAANGCDSTHRVQLSLLQPVMTSEVRTLCPGDSSFVFGRFERTAGVYQAAFTGVNGCDSTHQILLDFHELSISTEVVANVCAGADAGAGRVLIGSGTPPFAISWSDGTTSAEVNNLTAGTYFVSVTDGNGCTETDSLTITEVIGQDYTLTALPETCAGEADGRLLLEGDTTGLLVSINDGPFLPYQPLARYPVGDVFVRVIDTTGCRRSYDLTVALGNAPLLDLPASLVIDLGDSLTLRPQTNLPPGWPLDWYVSTGDSCVACPTLTLRPLSTVEVSVFALDENGCPAEDRTRIIPDRDKLFYVPTAFSPNGDGVNDLFRIFSGPAVERILSFGVFDRWGGRVFWVENLAPDDALAAWDGRRNGQDPNIGVHVYLVEVRLITGEVVKRAGEVSLIR